MSLYFESHVTIKKVEGEALTKFCGIARSRRFHVATFTKDTDGPDSIICTGRSKTREDLEARMADIIRILAQEGFEVTRYKLESTLIDSRIPQD